MSIDSSDVQSGVHEAFRDTLTSGEVEKAVEDGVKEGFQDTLTSGDVESAVQEGVKEGFQGSVSSYDVERAVEEGVQAALVRQKRMISVAVTTAVKEWLTENPDVIKDALRGAVRNKE